MPINSGFKRGLQQKLSTKQHCPRFLKAEKKCIQNKISSLSKVNTCCLFCIVCSFISAQMKYLFDVTVWLNSPPPVLAHLSCISPCRLKMLFLFKKCFECATAVLLSFITKWYILLSVRPWKVWRCSDFIVFKIPDAFNWSGVTHRLLIAREACQKMQISVALKNEDLPKLSDCQTIMLDFKSQ